MSTVVAGHAEDLDSGADDTEEDEPEEVDEEIQDEEETS
jgi:hypothetical protein